MEFTEINPFMSYIIPPKEESSESPQIEDNKNEQPKEDLEKKLLQSKKSNLQCSIHQISKTKVTFNNLDESAKKSETQLKTISEKLETNKLTLNTNFRESIKNISEREEVIEQMMTARMLSLANQAISVPIEKIMEVGSDAIKATCNSHPIMQKTCSKISDWSSEIGDAIADSIPSSVKESVKATIQHAEINYQNNLELMKSHNSKNLNISPELTDQFHKDLIPAISLFTVPPTLKAVKGLGATKVYIKEGTLSSTIKPAIQSSIKEDIIEKSLGKEILQKTMEIAADTPKFPKIILPSTLPQHLNKFSNCCEAHYFHVTVPREGRNGYVKGWLFYKQQENDILFHICRNIGYNSEMRKIINWTSWNGSHVEIYGIKSPENIYIMINEALRFSKSLNLKEAYITHNSKNVDYNKIENLIGIGSFSTGIDRKPFPLIKIKVPE